MVRTNPQNRAALIVAHGQPSDPEPAESGLRDLAGQVRVALPGWQIDSATLAAPGALDTAAKRFGAGPPIIYPFFMADGWFTRTNLPKRLNAAGIGAARVLPPFGADPALHALVVARLQETLALNGWNAADTTLILAAHGARKGAGSALATTAVAQAVRGALPFFDLRIGFIEEPPHIADTAWGAGDQALCLPLFVAGGGHVTDDLPRALQEAGFNGRLLPPIGTDARAPGVIAAALAAAFSEA